MLELNKIYKGDCVSLIKEIDDDSIDLIILDPPYNTTNEVWDKYDTINKSFSSELFRVAKKSCSLYVWCGIGEKSQSLIRWFPIFSERWHFKDLITWKKRRGNGMKKGWLYTREELMWFVKNNKSFIWNGSHQYSNILREYSNYNYKLKNGKNARDYIKSPNKRITNIWDDISETSFNTTGYDSLIKKHFTPKPLKALQRIISLHTKENDLILDCFGGSGNTAIAATNLGRRFILIEKDDTFVSMANDRIKNYSLFL